MAERNQAQTPRDSQMANSQPFECPPFKQLSQWLEGREELSEETLAHIEKCERCADLLAGLSDDAELREWDFDGSARSQFANESELRDVKSQLLENRSAAGGAKETHYDREGQRSTASGLGRTWTEETNESPPWSPAEIQQALPDGRFAIERLIGVGGAGAIYLAFDSQLAREVAVKVLSRGTMRERQRFERETKLLADIEHPNVVRIYDTGELSDHIIAADGRPPLYLVMEYMRGGPCGRLAPGKRSPSSDAPSFNNLAALVAAAADGVSAAHARGLVHRDIKPANLLLDEGCTTIKVADFGLARASASETAQITRTGDLVGTPAFMSPEQVEQSGNVAEQSDVYSLGATLYQLLTGEPPYQGSTAAVLRQVAEASPIRPRVLNPQVPSDLETICLHAMERAPGARYASMEEFAADLRRFADGRPILARPLTPAQQVVRVLRANPQFAGMLVVCLVLLIALAGGGIATALVFRAKNSELAEAVEGERAAKSAAEGALKDAIEAGDALLLTVATETELLPRTAGSQEVIENLLQRAKTYYTEFLSEHSENPALAFQLARAHAGLAEVASRVGDAETLEKETKQATDLLAELDDEDVDPYDRAKVYADAMVVWGNYLIESGEAAKAEAVLDAAVTRCDDVMTDSSPEGIRASYANAIMASAICDTWIGKPEEAMGLLAQAQQRFAVLRQEFPNKPRYLRNTAVCLMTLGSTAIDQGKPAEGKVHLLAANELLDDVDEEDAISLRIRELKTKLLTNLALAERRMGNNLQASKIYAEAIEETQRLIELEPVVSSHKWNLVVAALNSGGPDLALGNEEPLVERWRETVPQLDRLILAEPDNQRYQQVKAMLQSNIAMILRDMGKVEDAIEPLNAATATLLQQAKQLDFAAESYLPVAVNHLELAETFRQLKRWGEAIDSLDASDKIANEILDRQADFTPAHGQLLDGALARFDILAGSDVDTAKLVEVAEETVVLARMLCKENPDSAEYHVKLPRSLIQLTRGLRDSGLAGEALDVVREAFQAASDGKEKTDAEGVVELQLQAKRIEIELLERLVSDNDDPDVRKQLAEAKALAETLAAQAQATSDDP